jgi:hypothetical protein
MRNNKIITKDGYNQSVNTQKKVSTSNLTRSKFGIYSIAKRFGLFREFFLVESYSRQAGNIIPMRI